LLLQFALREIVDLRTTVVVSPGNTHAVTVAIAIAAATSANEERGIIVKVVCCLRAIRIVQLNTLHPTHQNRGSLDSIRFDSIRFNSIRFNSVQLNSIRFNSIQFDSTQFNPNQFNSIQSKSIQIDSLWRRISR